MKRSILFLAAAVLASSCFGITSWGADFYDINDVPWEGAKPYINKVADLELMVGDIHPTTGKPRFRSKENVSYCETTQLAYACLKKTGKLIKSDVDLVSKWTHVLKSFNIPQWAYECVSYALENEVLSLTDVSRFMKKDGNKITNGYASRESVAVIFGKMLKNNYPVNDNANLTFSDKASISSTSVPYVDLLARLGILVGDTDNNFTPKTYINRAEMAVLTSKTYEVLNGGTVPSNNGNANNQTTPVETEGTISGTISSIEDYGSNKLLSVTTTDGKQQGFMVNSTTYIVKGNSAEQVALAQLKKDMQVTVDFAGAKVNVIRVTSEIEDVTTEEKGVVDELTAQRIYLKNSLDKIISFTISADCEFTLDGKSRTMKEVFDAFEDNGMEAVLTIDASGYVTKAVMKTVEAEAYTGILVSIDREELNYKEKTGAKVQAYQWSNDPEIKYENKSSSIAKVQDYAVKKTLYVKFYLDSRERIKKLYVSEDKFSATSDKDDTMTGTVLSWSEKGNLSIRRLTNKDKETFTTTDDTKYYLDGKSSTENQVRRDYNKTDSNGDDYYVKVIFNSKDEVAKLYGSSKKSKIDGADYKKQYDGELIYLQTTSVKIDDGTSTRKEFTLSGDIEYYLDNKTSDAKSIKQAYADNDQELYVTIYVDDDDEVIRIEASKKRSGIERDESGTIKSISKSSITLGRNDDYDLDKDVKIKWDDSSISLSDFIDIVDDGDLTIKGELKVKSGNVTEIRAYTELASGQLAGVDYTDKYIKIETRDDTYKFILESRGVECSGTHKEVKDLEVAYKDGDDFKIELTFNDEGLVKKIYNSKK